ncbi:MAG: glycosyltransferase [Bacteroidales bacterium]|nr:glycosyltransferase [Bacteroidales bacterium]
MSESFLLRVSCMTFNQSAYITDALNGFVMQQTSFPFVCTIVDDASTDGEQEVIREYMEEYFDMQDGSIAYDKDTDYGRVFFARHKNNRNCYFAVVCLKENHYKKKSKTRYIVDWRNTKYVAICEGDDYWTDPLKLQKQVEFMEEHEECSVCSHRFNVLDQNLNKMEEDWLSPLFAKDSQEGFFYSNGDNYGIWITQPMTTVFRNSVSSTIDLKKYKYACDIHFYYHLLKSGKGYCFPFVGAVYRKHEGGVDSPFTQKDRFKMGILKYGDLYRHNREDKGLAKYYKRSLDLFCYQYVIQKLGEGKKDGTRQDFAFVRKEYRDGFGLKGWWTCVKKVAHASLKRKKK